MSRADGGYNPITGRSGEILSEAFRVQVAGGLLSGHQSSINPAGDLGSRYADLAPPLLAFLGW